MKVLLLGNSSTGKTTLLTTMYGCMQGNHELEYRLECDDSKKHAQLMEQYVKLNHLKEFPFPTQKTQSFLFHMYSQGQWLIDITVTDICGLDVHSAYRQTSIRTLMEHIRKADAVILCFYIDKLDFCERLERDSFNVLSLLRTCFETDSGSRILLPVFICPNLVQGEVTGRLYPFLNDCARNLGIPEMHTDFIDCEPIPVSCLPRLNVEFLVVALMRFWYANEVRKRKEKLEAERESILRQMGEYDGPILRFIRRILNLLHLDFFSGRARERYEKFSRKQAYYDAFMCPESEKLRKTYENLRINWERHSPDDEEDASSF